MKANKIGRRNIAFTFKLTEWDLNLHLILGAKRNYLIDTGLGSDSINVIKEYLGGDRKPMVVVNTHYHWDHVWGNDCFNNETIISHALCRQLIEENWSDMLSKNKRFIRGDVKLCLPNLVFENGLYFPDDKIKLFYTPGHTVDCISVFDAKDGVLNVGDNIGDTTDEIVPSLKTDTSTYLKSIHEYKSLNINACVSGHNTILSKEVFDKIENALTS